MSVSFRLLLFMSVMMTVLISTANCRRRNEQVTRAFYQCTKKCRAVVQVKVKHIVSGNTEETTGEGEVVGKKHTIKCTRTCTRINRRSFVSANYIYRYIPPAAYNDTSNASYTGNVTDDDVQGAVVGRDWIKENITANSSECQSQGFVFSKQLVNEPSRTDSLLQQCYNHSHGNYIYLVRPANDALCYPELYCGERDSTDELYTYVDLWPECDDEDLCPLVPTKDELVRRAEAQGGCIRDARPISCDVSVHKVRYMVRAEYAPTITCTDLPICNTDTNRPTKDTETQRMYFVKDDLYWS